MIPLKKFTELKEHTDNSIKLGKQFINNKFNNKI